MEQAAEALQYERAAALRDQLAALKQVQAQQIVTAEGDRDIDVFALVGEPGEFAISVMIIRGGRNLGSTSYFPKGSLAEPNEALASFLMQYYAETPPPAEILVNLELAEAEALIDALGTRAGSAHACVASVARAAGALDGDDGGERRRRRCACGARAARTSARCSPIWRGCCGLPRAPAAPRVLRHQPHGGRGHRGVVRGVRAGRTDEEGVPPLQHHRRDAGRRLRRAAPGTEAPLRTRQGRAKCPRPMCC